VELAQAHPATPHPLHSAKQHSHESGEITPTIKRGQRAGTSGGG